MDYFSKDELIEKLLEIKKSGWIKNSRPGNVGGIGNTVEDILGIEENNLPIPNASEWELKCQRSKTTSLTTLLHFEPSPRAIRFVPQVFLAKYSWKHAEAGSRYSLHEMSFRQTIHGKNRSDRGFGIIINNEERIVEVSFDAACVDSRHSEWLDSVEKRVGLGELNPKPYWGFDDLFHRAGVKLPNCFHLLADVKHTKSGEFYSYNKILMLQNFRIEKFTNALLNAYILVDFDARTGHNHGTKFRLRKNHLPDLYHSVTEIE